MSHTHDSGMPIFRPYSLKLPAGTRITFKIQIKPVTGVTTPTGISCFLSDSDTLLATGAIGRGSGARGEGVGADSVA